jgi:hypothetical protein
MVFRLPKKKKIKITMQNTLIYKILSSAVNILPIIHTSILFLRNDSLNNKKNSSIKEY